MEAEGAKGDPVIPAKAGIWKRPPSGTPQITTHQPPPTIPKPLNSLLGTTRTDAGRDYTEADHFCRDAMRFLHGIDQKRMALGEGSIRLPGLGRHHDESVAGGMSRRGGRGAMTHGQDV